MAKRWIKNKPLKPIKWQDIEPPPYFRKLYRPLGAIALTFSDLEAQLTKTLDTLLGTYFSHGVALEWLMQNTSLRIELFYFLALRSTRNETLRKDAENIYNVLKQANADRNNLLHGLWADFSSDDGSFIKTRLKAEGGGFNVIPLHHISLTLLRDEAKYIISVNLRLADWTQRFKAEKRPDRWPPPLPEKYRLHSPLASQLRENKLKGRGLPPLTSRVLGREPFSR